ncbi:MAG: TonB-dependent receptor [Flavobacteriales bacterium]|nr:TonB-dependent receptor [Flavobacteriia bacterium]NCP05401.1 TonB-dependent receptor [Flavobacteriales bacterium]PIV94939.1 MAG: TonB-dependent receptor [Flavobacteriaceae bacterium CG17_big_fil_post_rev_8_21_14_2_50_33_15]PIY11379.1 MAG: TonB-dependent receptor [Flavobacteriaceae bacterium CG_4_10_14_3_um_filter_33_47]PJB19206.1 MAG: TonB-dependent receptor [Flavobacteriaceae bacterium CG_4_9_14_3_um_filter_33_16]
MRKHIYKMVLAIVILSTSMVFSQEKDTINTGVINVVKPYTPTISDAFKVKETPSIDDEETATKKEIKYNIFSFPVASTFTPAKGKAAVVDKAKPVKLYDNYATLGVGTYTTILGEVYLNHSISRTESVGGYISHHSSQGGIEDLLLEDNFSNSKINMNYTTRLRDLTWNIEAGFNQQQYNWYGLPQVMVDDAEANNIKGGHSFYGIHFGSDVTFENSYINSGSFLFRRFGDNQGSGENRFVVKTTIDIPIDREEISTDLVFDYLSGTFDRNFVTTDELKYSNFQLGVTPKYQLKQDDLTVNLGFSVFYLKDNEANESNLYVYPNITATYRLVNDILIAYGGIEGRLIQNSYFDLASENPFVSPTLFIQPTDQLYNAYVGLKGKVSSHMSYNISGGYIADRNKALFINNEITATSQNYSYGNSFGIVYDDVDTFSLAGEINVDINRNFKLGIKAEYFSYNSDNQEEAWNLPDVKGSLFLDYQINEQWFAGANLFYVGERKDQFFLNNPLINTTPFTITLESYFDANVHLGYHVNEQLSVFAKANNLANEGYQKWQNFPVQSIQFLAGATYKFDF